jgi:hypothetical protein
MILHFKRSHQQQTFSKFPSFSVRLSGKAISTSCEIPPSLFHFYPYPPDQPTQIPHVSVRNFHSFWCRIFAGTAGKKLTTRMIRNI